MKLGKKKKKIRPTDWPVFTPPGGQETIFYLRVALDNILDENKLLSLLRDHQLLFPPFQFLDRVAEIQEQTAKEEQAKLAAELAKQKKQNDRKAAATSAK